MWVITEIGINGCGTFFREEGEIHPRDRVRRGESALAFPCFDRRFYAANPPDDQPSGYSIEGDSSRLTCFSKVRMSGTAFIFVRG